MKTWPLFEVPEQPAKLNIRDPLDVTPGPERDHAIKLWARAVWEMWRERHSEVERLLSEGLQRPQY